MTSRVQKGGQKFRPVVKPRGRPNEGSPDIPPRKPLSFREATVETFRAQSAQPKKPGSEISRLPSVPAVSSASVPKRRDESAPSHDTTSTGRDGQTNKPISLSSTTGGIRTDGTSNALDTDVTRHGAMTGVSNVSPPANSSQAIPIVTSSRSHSMQPLEREQAASIARQSVLEPSQIQPEPAPTWHSLLRNVSAPDDISSVPNEASEAITSVLEYFHHPETNKRIPEHQLWASAGLNDRHPQQKEHSQTKRKPRKKSSASQERSAVEATGEANRIENAMIRKRRTSTRPRRALNDSMANNQSHEGHDQAPRRSSRTRRPSSVRAETPENSDANSDSQDSESDAENRRKRRRRSSTVSLSTTTRGRHPRQPVIFDPTADPGEELDPTTVTMAAICDDTGQGRVSSKATVIQRNHLAWKTANRQKRERMRAIMEAKKFGKKPEEDEAHAQATQSAKEAEHDSDANESQIAESSATPAPEDASGNGFNYKESLAVNRFTAQVRIGPNGETIIDEESLFVDRADNADEGAVTYQHVEESDQTKFTNSASYGRKLRGSRWSAEETELFYDALSQFGENYELISYVLPGRDRKACKAKFKVEDRKNPNRITYCLTHRIPYDIQTLSRLTGKDFSGPTPEIKTPEIQKTAEESQEQRSEPEQMSAPDTLSRKQRKKSRTPAASDDVEVVGDLEI